MASEMAKGVRRSVTTAQGEISYLEQGSGLAALFVHGVLLNAHLWDGTVEHLAEQRRCLSVDLMGHGETVVPADEDLSFAAQAAMLLSFIDALELDQVDIVANDSGGGIVQILAARNPERVRTMTLTNCDTHDNLFPPAVVPLFEVIKAGKLLKIFKPMLDDPALRRNFFSTTLERPGDLPDELILSFIEPLIRNEEKDRPVQRWVEALAADDLLAVGPLLKGINAPTLVVWGTDDVFFEVKWAYWLKDQIPGVTEVVEVAGAKLFFPLEQPEFLADHIRRLWSGPSLDA